MKGEDLDTVFVLNELRTSTDNETSFDETLHRLKHDSNELNNHIVNLLETQIKGNLKGEIAHYRRIQALFPIISILFNDQTKVDIFVQIDGKKSFAENNLNLRSNDQECITGVS